MSTKIIKKILIAGFLTFVGTSCINDLDRVPFYGDNSEVVYKDFKNYKNVLAELYGGLQLTGQKGPAGKPDISTNIVDEGASNYIRSYWMLQTVPTDEAVLAWENDPGVAPLNRATWSADNVWVKAIYYRIFYQISLANEFIRETSDDKLSDRGIKGADADQARVFRAEARFLRALSYAHAIDLFEKVPFVTEADAPGAFIPPAITRKDLFNYVEKELLELVNENGSASARLLAANTNEYGRADKAAAWALLAKLYLNAEVYTGVAKYTEAIIYSSKVINAGYTLEPVYNNLFTTDNHNSNEIIFTVVADGQISQSYGSTTFLTNAATGATMKDFAVDSIGVVGWGGIRTTKNIVNLFPGTDGSVDERGTIHTVGHQLEIDEPATFAHGYGFIKFKNVSSNGVRGSHPDRVDTDFPMIRLAEMYLTYAEAVKRGGTGGSEADALRYVNLVRARAYNNINGNITQAQLTLDFILDERARELMWEGHRRTDLIRFKKFTGGSYLWPWKGGVKEGTSIPDSRATFPIPIDEQAANPNLR